MYNVYNSAMESNLDAIEMYQEHESLFSSIPTLVASYAKLPGFNTTYQTNIDFCKTSTTGLTEVFNAKKKILVSCICVPMNRIYQYARLNGQTDLMEESKVTISAVSRFGTAELTSASEHCFQLAERLKDKWAEIGLTQEMMDNMLNANENFLQSTIMPEELKYKLEAAHKKLEDTRVENTRVCREEILPTLRIEFGDSHPELVDRYLSIFRTHKVTHRKRALEGQIVDSATGEPITDVMISIDDTDVNRRVRSEQGRFFVQNLKNQEYIIRCTHQRYETLVFRFTHVWGETTKLRLEMVAKPIEELEGVVE